MSTDTIKATRFTAEQVLEALETAVKGKEEYVDPRTQMQYLACKYVIDGAPSCIVGQTLAILGVPVKVLNLMDCAGNPSFAGDGYTALAQAGFTVDSIGRQMLVTAQTHQDSGKTWGEALSAARAMYLEKTTSPA